MNYVVGKVFYVILNKEMKIYPMQTTQEITKRTINGEEKSYIARGGPPDNSTEVDVSKIDGIAFPTAEAAKESLVKTFTQRIDAMINVANKKSVEWYGATTTDHDQETYVVPHEGEDIPNIESVRASAPIEGDVFTLPDGTTAKVRNVIMPDQMRLRSYVLI